VYEVNHKKQNYSMSHYRYSLAPYTGMNSRYRCPSCQDRDRTFTLYIDNETGETIHPDVGRCSREAKCGYHYSPRQYFLDYDIAFNAPDDDYYFTKALQKAKPIPKPASFISEHILVSSLKKYETNQLVIYLRRLFGVTIAENLICKYFIGTSKKWEGATVFWQIDVDGKIRAGKIMLYNPSTGKRIREPFSHLTWVHYELKMPDFELRQCFFGEHLLGNNTMPVAIVESEETAIIASVYIPEFIWLAAGSLNSLNAEKCAILKGRQVILFPDLNGYEKWSEKANELSHYATFTVSDILERNGNEAETECGYDLADYLIRYNHKEAEIRT
jgi:hypothetical protein